MKNKIVYVDQAEAGKILYCLTDDPNTFCVEIDGKICRASSDFLPQVYAKFQFPIPEIRYLYDGYLDWITDLTWIKEENIAFIIKNYDDFLCDDPSDKEWVMRMFTEYIFPWWEFEVCGHVVEGRPRLFRVYIVE